MKFRLSQHEHYVAGSAGTVSKSTDFAVSLLRATRNILAIISDIANGNITATAHNLNVPIFHYYLLLLFILPSIVKNVSVCSLIAVCLATSEPRSFRLFL
jgi:hypothetical protein